MLVKGIVPRGYCKGVVRAIEIAKKQAHQTAPVYILGMIVHNQYIVNVLDFKHPCITKFFYFCDYSPFLQGEKSFHFRLW